MSLRKRGQYALENILLGTMLITVLIVIAYFALNYAEQHYRAQQIDDSLNTLYATANAVMDLGVNNQENVFIDLPSDVRIGIQDNNKLAAYSTSTGEIEKTLELPFNLVGYPSKAGGPQDVRVKAIDGNTVRFQRWLYISSLDPSSIFYDDLPLTATIIGGDYSGTTNIVVDGIPYPDIDTNYINQGELSFLAQPLIFLVNPGEEKTFYLQVNDSASPKSDPYPFVVSRR